MSFSPQLFAGSGCILEFINQGSMRMIVVQSALLESGIDWLRRWASCQFSLVVSVLSPLFVSHLSLLLMSLSLSALIEMY